MNKFLSSLVAIAVMFGAGVGGYYLQKISDTGSATDVPVSAAPDAGRENLIGSKRPVFSLPNLQGEMRSISEWDGDILAINFWATWCKPCKDEIPEFVELQEKYRDQNVTFVGVAVDRPQPVSDFVDRYGMNYPVLIGEQAAIKAAKAYGNRIGALPYTAFVDRTGHIVRVHRGRLSMLEAERILRSLIPASG